MGEVAESVDTRPAEPWAKAKSKKVIPRAMPTMPLIHVCHMSFRVMGTCCRSCLGGRSKKIMFKAKAAVPTRNADAATASTPEAMMGRAIRTDIAWQSADKKPSATPEESEP